MASSALAPVRAAAELARAEPTEENLHAVRTAIAEVISRHRYDDKGYNPYRDKDGKFGAGAHKERPKVGRAPGAVPEGLSAAKVALGKARAAAEVARKSPTAENKAAARKAVGEAGAAVGRKPSGKKAAASAEKHAAAKEASDRAHKASEKAHMSGEASGHRAAVLAHERASKAQRAAGGHREAVDHDLNASSHLRHAETIDSLEHGAGRSHADRASERAGDASAHAQDTGHSHDHAEAANAHKQAEELHRQLGNESDAAMHASAAAYHERESKQATPAKTTKDPGLERLEKARQNSPTPHGHLIDAIGNGGIKDNHGNVVSLTPEAQSAMRDHFGMLAEKEGAIRHGGMEQHKLVSRSVDEMGAASGMHYPTTGRIDLNAETLKHLEQHAGDDAYDHNRTMQDFKEFDNYGGRGMVAYNVMMHETFHGYGPHFKFADNDSGNVARYQFVNEMSTEMAARHLTAKVHGFEAHKIRGGGYDDVMREAVGHAAEVSGASHERAFAAVSEAALSLKRQGHAMTPDEGISHMADHVAKSLGAHDASLELQGRWGGLAHEMNQRYPWP